MPRKAAPKIAVAKEGPLNAVEVYAPDGATVVVTVEDEDGGPDDSLVYVYGDGYLSAAATRALVETLSARLPENKPLTFGEVVTLVGVRAVVVDPEPDGDGDVKIAREYDEGLWTYAKPADLERT